MTQWLRRHRADILLFVVAVLWFLPAVWWGLPTFGRDGRMNRWGPDELGPWGAINALRMLTDDPIVQRGPQFRLGPQYPLVHYLVQGILVWPYHAFVKLADHIGPGRHFHSLQGLMVLHRLPSVLL